MRWSRLFILTLRDDPADAEIVSHRLLVRAAVPRARGSCPSPVVPEARTFWGIFLPTEFDGAEILVPQPVRSFGLGRSPLSWREEILAGDLALGSSFEETISQVRRKVRPLNLWHQPPNVSRASSSLIRFRSAGFVAEASLSIKPKK